LDDKIEFIYRDTNYKYCEEPGERTIEVPIAWNLLARCNYNFVLEVGNVMWHRAGRQYMKWHDVVDKYEVCPGIAENVDIMNYNTTRRYRLILCISTIEHIGHDRTPYNPTKCLNAYDKMKSLLMPKGLLFITWPFGYNRNIDDHFFNDMFDFDEVYFMKRISEDNKWEECSIEDAKVAKYNDPYPAGNVTIFGYHHKK